MKEDSSPADSPDQYSLSRLQEGLAMKVAGKRLPSVTWLLNSNSSPLFNPVQFGNERCNLKSFRATHRVHGGEGALNWGFASFSFLS